MSKNKDKKKAKKLGIIITVCAVVLILSITLAVLFSVGVIKPPAFLASYFSGEVTPSTPSKSANIAPQGEAYPPKKALSAGEYAIALADMNIPQSFYMSYKITLFSDTNQSTTDYVAIKDGDTWWVQASKNDIILTTAICKNNVVKITDNASNSSVVTDAYSETTPSGITFKERCEFMPLSELVQIIKAVDSGETVTYGGGITTYSLSYTQSRSTSENLFSFSFSCENGISEEYIFSFERAVILSATKKYGDKIIYQMELKDSRDDLSDIHLDELTKIN